MFDPIFSPYVRINDALTLTFNINPHILMFSSTRRVHPRHFAGLLYNPLQPLYSSDNPGCLMFLSSVFPLLRLSHRYLSHFSVLLFCLRSLAQAGQGENESESSARLKVELKIINKPVSDTKLAFNVNNGTYSMSRFLPHGIAMNIQNKKEMYLHPCFRVLDLCYHMCVPCRWKTLRYDAE